jgi:hypothetical protein
VNFYADGVECDTECHSPTTPATKTDTQQPGAGSRELPLSVIHYDDIYLIL